MAQITTEGKITLEVNNHKVELVTKVDHKTIDTITLDDTYYQDDTISLLKNLMGEVMQCIKDLSSGTVLKDTIEDELDNLNIKETNND